jgi:hypothetical protein
LLSLSQRPTDPLSYLVMHVNIAVVFDGSAHTCCWQHVRRCLLSLSQRPTRPLSCLVMQEQWGASLSTLKQVGGHTSTAVQVQLQYSINHRINHRPIASMAGSAKLSNPPGNVKLMGKTMLRSLRAEPPLHWLYFAVAVCVPYTRGA